MHSSVFFEYFKANFVTCGLEGPFGNSKMTLPFTNKVPRSIVLQCVKPLVLKQTKLTRSAVYDVSSKKHAIWILSAIAILKFRGKSWSRRHATKCAL